MLLSIGLYLKLLDLIHVHVYAIAALSKSFEIQLSSIKLSTPGVLNKVLKRDCPEVEMCFFEL